MALATKSTIFWAFCIGICLLIEVSQAIRCKCSEHSCPGDRINDTCTTTGKCYKKIAEEEGYELITYGCLPPEEQTDMQCNTPASAHRNKISVLCCNNRDLCNFELDPTFPPPTSPTIDVRARVDDESSGSKKFFILFVTAGVCTVVLVIVLVILYIRFRDVRRRLPLSYDLERRINFISSGETLKDYFDQSSASGSGLPLLVQRTIAKQVTLVQSVGKGRYGEVWKARWHGEDVAVKIFLSHCEKSWMRETEIYQTVLLRHESILGFIASDIIGSGQVTQMYLIMDYHPLGSLYDFLRGHQLNKKITGKLAFSAAAGIAHLHAEILGTQGKPMIAHRDIKSKNILVKENLTCCIADFGLAVKYIPETKGIDLNKDTNRVGTKRYMSPEVLSQTMDPESFSAYKMADMYSFALVLWEISRRCISDETGLCEEYEVPYFDAVSNDPTFEEMKRVVVLERRRPNIPNRWFRDEMLRTMGKLMAECWSQQPAARLTALRVKKSLSKLVSAINSHEVIPAAAMSPD
ncbi:bone morphogenetic protein receptor type-1B [Nematostella vectensis]|uniref:bone morphogenetic protein receptor type-1B n=1 Tax=Nematostella vectensis TaxID=45351 RepID=UPI002076FA21|nr:bone morphogenetic protein receptor type-1B [Nematostella vectensis]